MTVTGNEQKNSTNMDAELEYARRLLQKCSDTKSSSLTIGKYIEKNRYIYIYIRKFIHMNFIMKL